MRSVLIATARLYLSVFLCCSIVSAAVPDRDNHVGWGLKEGKHFHFQPLITPPEQIPGTTEWWTDQLVFSRSLKAFKAYYDNPALRDALPRDIDWSLHPGCPHRRDNPHGFQFKWACNRRYFGHNNAFSQGRLNDALFADQKEQLRQDLQEICDQELEQKRKNKCESYHAEIVGQPDSNWYNPEPRNEPRVGIDISCMLPGAGPVGVPIKSRQVPATDTKPAYAIVMDWCPAVKGTS